jgi:hypothetical protein
MGSALLDRRPTGPDRLCRPGELKVDRGPAAVIADRNP